MQENSKFDSFGRTSLTTTAATTEVDQQLPVKGAEGELRTKIQFLFQFQAIELIQAVAFPKDILTIFIIILRSSQDARREGPGL